MSTMTPILAALVLLSACAAATPPLGSDVSTYRQWTPGRWPVTYAFERLPSQQRWGERQQQFENAARSALERAGFTQAANRNEADVIVHVGARAQTTRAQDPSAATRRKPRMPPNDYDDPAYVTIDLREVALLIRDRESGRTLYGARASNRGRSVSDPTILATMFEAAIMDLPNARENPAQ